MEAPEAILCSVYFQEDTLSHKRCIQHLGRIIEKGYTVLRDSTDLYVLKKLTREGLLRRTRIYVCGDTSMKVVYVANRSFLARLRAALELLDRAQPACIEQAAPAQTPARNFQ